MTKPSLSSWHPVPPLGTLRKQLFTRLWIPTVSERSQTALTAHCLVTKTSSQRVVFSLQIWSLLQGYRAGTAPPVQTPQPKSPSLDCTCSAKPLSTWFHRGGMQLCWSTCKGLLYTCAKIQTIGWSRISSPI